jgi:hypothetical protein
MPYLEEWKKVEGGKLWAILAPIVGWVNELKRSYETSLEVQQNKYFIR